MNDERNRNRFDLILKTNVVCEVVSISISEVAAWTIRIYIYLVGAGIIIIICTSIRYEFLLTELFSTTDVTTALLKRARVFIIHVYNI